MARTGLIYGESGTFKTTQIKWFARYIYKKTGKPIRLISADLGGYAPCEPEVRAGLIIPWRVSTIDNFLPVLRKLSKGYWPIVKEKDSGLPDKRKIQYLDLQSPSADTWNNCGGYAVESLTSIGDAEMANLVATGRKVSEEVVGVWEEKVMVDGQETKESFGAPAKSHYGFVQNAIYSTINAFSSLPVEYVLFTALEAKAEEEDRTTIYGPSVAGKKATPKVPSWVGDCIHHDSIQVPTQVPVLDAAGQPVMAQKLASDGKPEPGAKPVPKTETVMVTKVRAYFMRHPDPKTNVNHPAKPRIVPERWEALLKKWPSGFYEPTTSGGFDLFLEEEDKFSDEGTADLVDWKKQVDELRAKAGK